MLWLTGVIVFRGAVVCGREERGLFGCRIVVFNVLIAARLRVSWIGAARHGVDGNIESAQYQR